jgi:hypothetical protein
MPKIFVLSGPDVGMSFEVVAGSKLGRASDCAVVLRHGSVSRHHAHLELDGGSWWVVDLDSRNGLHVDGERVLRAAIADGGEFMLGEVSMRLRIPAEEVTGKPPKSVAHVTEPGPGVYSTERVAVPHGDDIVLEGDWDPDAATVAPSSPSRPAAGGASVSGAAPIVREESARERASAKLAAAGALPKAQTGGRGVLQFNKVEARAGFMTSELGQQPWWIQVGVGLLVLAVFLGVLWLAFQGTVWFRSGSETPPAIEQESR